MSQKFILNIEINSSAFKNIKDIIESCNGKIGSVTTDPNHSKSQVISYFATQQHQMFCKYLLLQRDKKIQDLEKVYVENTESSTESVEKKKNSWGDETQFRGLDELRKKLQKDIFRGYY